MLKVGHTAGFFSCSTICLENIVSYFNTHHKLPDILDRSYQYDLYKPVNNSSDVSHIYFTETSDIIKYNGDIKITTSKSEQQFSDYRLINHSAIKPFIQRYFTPSALIQDIILMIKYKYKIDYNNTCVLFYRGNDKMRETNACSYDEIIQKARIVRANNPNITFLIQSDETEFIERMLHEFPGSIYFNNEIRHMKKCDSTVDLQYVEKNPEYSMQFLAITCIMSKCKYIICNSGNCSLWIILYRGNSEGLYQYLEPKEYIYNIKNTDYNPSQTNFWLS